MDVETHLIGDYVTRLYSVGSWKYPYFSKFLIVS